FLSRMKALYRLYRLSSGREMISTRYQEQMLHYVRDCRSPALLWALVRGFGVDGLPARRESGSQERLRRGVLAEAANALRGVPGLGYAARYEYARCLLHGGARAEARKVFQDLHAETLTAGQLPPVDATFRRALGDGAPGTGPWRALMRRTAERWLAAKGPLAA